MNKIVLSIATAAAAFVVAPQTAHAQIHDTPCSDEQTCWEVDNSGTAILGNSTDSTGVVGQSVSGDGVDGYSTDGIAIFGQTGNTTAIEGSATGHGDGVYGTSTGGSGVFGTTGSNAQGTAGGFFTATGGGSSSTALAAENSGSGGGLYASSVSGAAGYFSGDLDYTAGSNHVSDERLKRDIEPLKDPIGQVLRTRGVSFYWKDPSKHGNVTGIQRGFIAQEFEKAFPEWVSTGPDGFKMIDTTGLDALEVESIRTLKTENDLLKQRVAALESSRQPRISGFNLNGVGLGVGGWPSASVW